MSFGAEFAYALGTVIAPYCEAVVQQRSSAQMATFVQNLRPERDDPGHERSPDAAAAVVRARRSVAARAHTGYGSPSPAAGAATECVAAECSPRSRLCRSSMCRR